MDDNLLKFVSSFGKKNLLETFQNVLNQFYCVFMLDANRRLLFANSRFSENTGYSIDYLKDSKNSLKNSLFNSVDFNHINDVIKSKGGWEGHIHLTRKDGDCLWLDVVAFNLENEKGGIGETIFIGSVITEFKKAMEIKQMFLANMSHELRTPIHGILGITNLLFETNPTREQTDYIKHLQNAVEVLSKMVDDLMDMNKIESGRLKIVNEAFNLMDNLNQISQLLIERIKAKNLDYKLILDNNIPKRLIGDPFRLKQILIQLIENAIKFSDSGLIKLEVSSCKEIDNKYFLIQFQVTDEGIGIPKNKLDFILEKFHQVEMDDSRAIGGAGLGLTIVKNIIQLQGGNFNIESTEGQGTEVCFCLKFMQADNQFGEKSIRHKKNKTRTLKVLIAEDVEMHRMVLKKLMQKLGYDGEFAENGKVLIEMLKQSEYDVVLMDMQMPVMDGFEAIKYIRQNMPEPICSIPIISVTANKMDDAPVLCINAGANDYLSKPFGLEDIRKKIDDLVYL